jgi:hypothetical protein
MKTYDHLVHFDEGTGKVLIFRIDIDGQKTLYSSVSLPASNGWNASLESFAKQLGENLLLDSPIARKALNL